MATLKGTWRFHDTIIFPEESFVEYVNFTVSLKHGYIDYVGYVENIIIDSEWRELRGYVYQVIPSDLYFETGEGIGYQDEHWMTVYGEQLQIFNFGLEPQEVSDKFYNWLLLNAEPYYTKKLKGSWRLKDTLNHPEVPFIQPINFSFSDKILGDNTLYDCHCTAMKWEESTGTLIYTISATDPIINKIVSFDIMVEGTKIGTALGAIVNVNTTSYEGEIEVIS